MLKEAEEIYWMFDAPSSHFWWCGDLGEQIINSSWVKQTMNTNLLQKNHWTLWLSCKLEQGWPNEQVGILNHVGCSRPFAYCYKTWMIKAFFALGEILMLSLGALFCALLCSISIEILCLYFSEKKNKTKLWFSWNHMEPYNVMKSLHVQFVLL